MKNTVCMIFFLISATLLSQIDTLSQKMVSMQDTYEKPYTVGSVYYEKGSAKPYTGVLYGKFANGNYLSIQEYKNGVGNGTWINYYEDGTIKEVGTYRENRVEGPIKQYRKDGSLKAEGHYKHWRTKIGVWKFYDAKGILVTKKDFGS